MKKFNLLFFCFLFTSLGCTLQQEKKKENTTSTKQTNNKLTAFIEEFSSFLINEPQHATQILELKDIVGKISIMDSLNKKSLVSNTIPMRFWDCDAYFNQKHRECRKKFDRSQNAEVFRNCFRYHWRIYEECLGVQALRNAIKDFNIDNLNNPEKAPNVIAAYKELSVAYLEIEKIIADNTLDETSKSKNIVAITNKLKNENLILSI